MSNAEQLPDFVLLCEAPNRTEFYSVNYNGFDHLVSEPLFFDIKLIEPVADHICNTQNYKAYRPSSVSPLKIFCLVREGIDAERAVKCAKDYMRQLTEAIRQILDEDNSYAH